MSESPTPEPGKPGPPKKGVSPTRNLIGVVLLIALGIVVWFEYSAKFGYDAAVRALEERTQNEEKGLASVQEADEILKRPADGPGTDVTEGATTYTKKTYTWRGLLKSYPLAAYYTKEKEPHLHH